MDGVTKGKVYLLSENPSPFGVTRENPLQDLISKVAGWISSPFINTDNPLTHRVPSYEQMG